MLVNILVKSNPDVEEVNPLYGVYLLTHKQASRHSGFKVCHQNNHRSNLEFDLCDLEIWVNVIITIFKARFGWAASIVLAV